MKNKIKFAWYFCEAYIKNQIAAYLDRRLENKRQSYHAYNQETHAGRPLGRCNMHEAMNKVDQFGTVIYADPVQGAIFYTSR